MRLTQKAQVTLFGACVASLIFAGTVMLKLNQ